MLQQCWILYWLEHISQSKVTFHNRGGYYEVDTLGDVQHRGGYSWIVIYEIEKDNCISIWLSNDKANKT